MDVVGGEFEGRAAEVFFEPGELGCAGDGDYPGFLGEEPCEGNLRGRGLLLLSELRHEVHDGLVGFAVFFGEAWDDGAEVGAVELGGAVDLAGEETFAERAEGDEADAEFFEGGHDGLFRLAPEEGVLALEGGDGLYGVGAADGVGTSFGEAEVLDLACGDEVFDGPGGVFDGGVGVDAVLVVEVDDVGLEALEGGFDDLLDVFGLAVGGGPLAVVVGVGLKAELGGDDDIFAEGREGFADDFFIDVGAVDFGGVEEGDAALDSGADELDGFRFFRGGAEAEAQTHAAEAEC